MIKSSVEAGALLDALAAHEGPATPLSFSPAGPLLAIASWDHTVHTWDISRSALLLPSVLLLKKLENSCQRPCSALCTALNIGALQLQIL